ncbi:MAG: aminotransferase class I/II-fold pyridoxal phosphate-dependent enzyme [Leptospiraceae bacterium]|nr:aminotransferase class I/II-fold pyridoxal phosphate-dependent enzyme [Leptospiraceae bacterium]
MSHSPMQNMSSEELQSTLRELQNRHKAFCAEGHALDMTRGKPAGEQLDLANAMLDLPGAEQFRTTGGVDTRNYGGLEGLPEARALLAAMLDVKPDAVLMGGNSSLTLMHDAVVRALLHGVPGGQGPWKTGGADGVKFLCPVPGYDRHFSICEHFNIEMIPVPMTAEGPDMDAVESLVARDASIKGIWCVPRYSNPTGCVYSDAVVDRLARMQCAAPDFRIFWDNAYAVHHLTESPQPLKSISAACTAAGNPDRPYLFASTSKISFAGSGISAFAASPANVADAKKHLSMQTIGPDKVNQWRHVQFFENIDGVHAHMRKHAAIIAPKFQRVLEIFRAELEGRGIADWTEPDGGYFISLDVPEGCAARVVSLAGEAGVKLTPAGATFPYRKDTRDANLRIAPTLPAMSEIETAMRILCVCVRLAAAEKLIGRI